MEIILSLKLSRMKQTVRVYLILPIVMRISILEVCRFLCGFTEKNVVVITRWCNFR